MVRAGMQITAALADVTGILAACIVDQGFEWTGLSITLPSHEAADALMIRLRAEQGSFLAPRTDGDRPPAGAPPGWVFTLNGVHFCAPS